jgi:hypothetical protein
LITHKSISHWLYVGDKLVKERDDGLENDEPVMIIEIVTMVCPDVDNLHKVVLNEVKLFVWNEVVDHGV